MEPTLSVILTVGNLLVLGEVLQNMDINTSIIAVAVNDQASEASKDPWPLILANLTDDISGHLSDNDTLHLCITDAVMAPRVHLALCLHLVNFFPPHGTKNGTTHLHKK